MAKRGCIITNGFLLLPSFSYCQKRLKEEFEALDVQVEEKTTVGLLTLIGEESPLPSYDFILYLDKDPYLANYLEQKGYRLFNQAEAIRLCDDKGLTHLSLQGIVPMPRTILVPLNYSSSISLPYLDRVQSELGLPLVAKKSFGSRGEGVRLIETREQLVSLEREWKNIPHLYQEYIASSKGIDHRLILIGGRFYCGYLRKAKGDEFRSNLGLGGEGFPCDISQEEIDLAEKAAQALNLDYCGVDLLFDKDGKPLLCEANSNAFFEGAEKVTGKNVAKAYCEYILKSIG